MDQKLFLLCIIFSLYSCEPGIVFKEASPPTIAPVFEVPEYFQGVYLCESDSSTVHIKRKSILQETYYQFVTTLDKVIESENCSIVDGGLYLSGRKECIPFEYLNDDSITAKIYTIDTIFAFREGEIAKYYKGQLFINLLNDQGNWITWILRPGHSDDLEFLIVSLPNADNILDNITASYEQRSLGRNRTQYIIRPTLIEFDQLLNKDFSIQCETLKPVNIEFEYPFDLKEF